jgi:predicted RNA-binding protein associated with RNAse of E/G family
VIRTWLESSERFHGWYVNLEQPWVRTTLGFDSRDDVLDVAVADDLGACRLKDEDELKFAVEVGKLTAAEARSIRSTATSAVEDIAHRRWPFDDRAWLAFRPDPDDQPPDLPLDFDTP